LTTTGILARHDFHGEWNYTLHPADHQPGHTQGEKT
jgi:hypothetical protein